MQASAHGPGVDQVQTLVMDFSPVAKAMSFEALQPDRVQGETSKPLGDENMGDGEGIKKHQPDEIEGFEGEGLPNGDGKKAETPSNIPESSPPPGGPSPPMGSVFDEEVGQVSKKVMKQNVE